MRAQLITGSILGGQNLELVCERNKGVQNDKSHTHDNQKRIAGIGAVTDTCPENEYGTKKSAGGVVQ